jgi:uncharacterized protein YuzE
MKLTYEQGTDSAYLYVDEDIMPGEVKLTVPVDMPVGTGGMIQLDIGHDGMLLGIEILNASRLLPFHILRATSVKQLKGPQ